MLKDEEIKKSMDYNQKLVTSVTSDMLPSCG